MSASATTHAHPLRLSLCEVEYESASQTITVSLRLFLMDINEALVFDPDNNVLALGQADESADAEELLLAYLNDFFYLKVNGRRLELKVKTKRLSGNGDNVALGLLFEFPNVEFLNSLEIKNAVFTDLFFDQNNIIYVHVNGESKSLMLNKKTPIHTLDF
ncbi:MAG: DUF6702 family protein [Pseudomonadota bacterium]